MIYVIEVNVGRGWVPYAPSKIFFTEDLGLKELRNYSADAYINFRLAEYTFKQEIDRCV